MNDDDCRHALISSVITDIGEPPAMTCITCGKRLDGDADTEGEEE